MADCRSGLRPCERYGPSVEAIADTFRVYSQYGLVAPDENADIWDILIRHARDHPLAVYCLGAFGNMEKVCIPASRHTLSQPLSTISEADAVMMGPQYLQRLFQLHITRVSELKRILSETPRSHPPTTACDLESQKGLELSWRAAASDILLQELPQTTTAGQLLSSFGPISSTTQCLHCKGVVQECLSSMLDAWKAVKMTV